MVTVSEALFAQINTICEMTIPAVALSLQTFAFRIKPHLILFSISFPESSMLVSESCRWTQGLCTALCSSSGRTWGAAICAVLEGKGLQMDPSAGSSGLGHGDSKQIHLHPDILFFLNVCATYVCTYIHLNAYLCI